MDLTLSRLSKGACAATIPGASEVFQLRDGDTQTLTPDNEAFSRLVTQLAPAVMPAVLAPVTTSGPRGFEVQLQTNVSAIDSNAYYWEKGTRGHGNAARATCDGENRFVTPALTSNRLSVDKGLPFGFTIGAEAGRLWNTSLFTLGGHFKWALFEGYRTFPLPDFAVRAAANTLVGDSQLTMLAATADAILSKNIVVGRVMQIAPYLGGGVGLVYASSQLVDLTPNIDATRCAAGEDPICKNLSAESRKGDIGHDQAFEELTLLRTRGFLGAQLRYSIFALSGEFAFDLIAPDAADKDAGRGLPRQWSVNLAPSLSF